MIKIMPASLSKKILPVAAATAISAGALLSSSTTASANTDSYNSEPQIVNNDSAVNTPYTIPNSKEAEKIVKLAMKNQLELLDQRLDSLKTAKSEGQLGFEEYYEKSKTLIETTELLVPKYTLKKADNDKESQRATAVKFVGIALGLFIAGLSILRGVFGEKNCWGKYTPVPLRETGIGIASGIVTCLAGWGIGTLVNTTYTEDFQKEKEIRIEQLNQEKAEYIDYIEFMK